MYMTNADSPIDSAPARRVCAVVVTYHPDGGLPERLSRVLPQVESIIVVDNGSADAELSLLQARPSESSLHVIRNLENLGIARALNIGVRRALVEGYAWALLLDQDTEVDTDMVDRLLGTHATFPQPDQVALVGSRFRDTKGRSNEPIRLGARGDEWEEVESVITSGSLLSLSAYTAIGPFRDEFFIDYVDVEFCLRARAAGYRVVQTLVPLMSHTVGDPTSHKALWETQWTSNHSAERRYYMARNNTALLREYGTSGRSSWQWKSITRCFRLCKRIAFFERDKTDKIAAVAQGWWDGVRGRMGPRPKP